MCILSCDWLQDPGGIVRAEHRYREGGAERKQLEAAELNQLLRELRDKEAEYMNLLYSAVAAQGGGSVEAAMSPYLAMTAPTPDRYHQFTIVSAIYEETS